MKQLLVLDHSTASLVDTKFLIKYYKHIMDPLDPRNDGSHVHDCYEFYFNLSGNVSFFVNNRLYPIKKGDIIFTRPGDIHFCVYHEKTLHEFFCLWISAEETSCITEFTENFFKDNFYSCYDHCEEISDILFRLDSASKKDNKLAQTAEILNFLLFLDEKRNDHPILPPSSLPLEIQRIVDDINDNFTEIRSVTDILERHYISQATLNRRFRKYMQISPRVFLETKKLTYAKKLLAAGASVTDACFQAGFSDCSHFISVFKQKFGETPYKYKCKCK